MGFLSNTLNLVGAILLAHAIYSAYETSLLPSRATPAPASPSHNVILAALNPKIDLPLDITLETLVSVVLLCAGVVLGSPELKPIQWREWAGRLEREKRKPVLAGGEAGIVDNPYKALDERPGFVDIRGKRREFAAWMREAGGKGKA